MEPIAEGLACRVRSARYHRVAAITIAVCEGKWLACVMHNWRLEPVYKEGADSESSNAKDKLTRSLLAPCHPPKSLHLFLSQI